MADFRDLDDPATTRASYALTLEALELQVGLGIHPIERAGPQRVIVTVTLYCDYGVDRPVDHIDAVVDYDFLREQIILLASSRHFELQETLCEAIAAIAFGDPRVVGARVSTAKPEIYPDAVIGCQITRRRPV